VLDEIELRRAARGLAPPGWTENGKLRDMMGIPLRRSPPSRLSAPRARSPGGTYLGQDAGALARGLKACLFGLDNPCRARGAFGRHWQMKWQIPCVCAKHATTGRRLSILAGNDFEFAEIVAR
jgi:hypothetical protein